PIRVIISSVRPSLKYSWLGSPVRLAKGSTASIGRAAGEDVRRWSRVHRRNALSATKTMPAGRSQGRYLEEFFEGGPAGTDSNRGSSSCSLIGLQSATKR